MSFPGRKFITAALLAPAVVAGMLLAAGPASANAQVNQVSSDPFTDVQAQHQTEVEPDTFAFGNTIVSAFQVGRVFNGGASDVGFATSTNNGATWTSGFLPGVTGNVGGPCGQASDAAVAFDAKHNVWLISFLGVNCPGTPVFTSRSTDGGLTWSTPIVTATGSNDKNWIVCDNSAGSPFFGNCYTEFDITSLRDSMRMTTSSDGGLTWGPAAAPGGNHNGLAGQPVVQPNGTVVVPYLALNEQIRSFTSTDGGASWSDTTEVSPITEHEVAGDLRTEALPSAEIDAAGTVYLVWQDCRFRADCSSNDIVLSTSSDGTTWSDPARVPIDDAAGTVDHFVPGIGVDPSSSGGNARIGLTYYFYPNANCTPETCQLSAGFISSTNGGATWSDATQVAGPMSLSWLPDTSQGRMFGDYISTSVLAGRDVVVPILPIAAAPSGSTFDMGMFAVRGGLHIIGGQRRDAAPPRPMVTAGQPASVTAF